MGSGGGSSKKTTKTTTKKTVKKTAAGSGGYKPSSDLRKVAADRVNSAARSQFDENAAAKRRAISDWQASVDSLNSQAQESTTAAERQNEQARARLNNVMADRGIAQGEGTGVNFANNDLAAAAALAAITRDRDRQLGNQAHERDNRITAIDDQTRTLKAQLPSKIDELAMALENQDFSRWQAMQSLAMQREGLNQQSAEAEKARAWQLDMFNKQLGVQHEADMQAIRNNVLAMAKKGDSWTDIQAYLTAQGRNPDATFWQSLVPQGSEAYGAWDKAVNTPSNFMGMWNQGFNSADFAKRYYGGGPLQNIWNTLKWGGSGLANGAQWLWTGK